MMNLTILTIVGIALLTELVGSCDVMLIKKMAVSVCSLNKKRSFSSDSELSVLELNLGISVDVEQQYKELIESIDESEELLLTKTDNKKSKKEPTTTTARNRPSHLSFYLQNMMYRKTTSPPPKLNARMSAVIKRDNISALVQECCSRQCTIDDFRIICGKK